MKKVQVKGTIVADEDKWIYEWFGMEAASPSDLRKALVEADGDEVTAEINSGGGDLFAGNEMYYLLQSYQGRTTADIMGFAGSAATIICCGADHVRAVPGALYMIHNVSGYADGDYHAMDAQSRILKEANRAAAKAYQQKTGLQEPELLALMDKETWMSAESAKAKGFVDEIIGDNPVRLYNSFGALSPDVLNKVKAMIRSPAHFGQGNLLQAKLKLLKLKGESHYEV